MYQTGFESPELESILHLMYVGEGKFYEERRGEFVRAATELEIEQISDNDVTWHNFSDHLRTILEDLYRTGVYSDVTLISEDKTEFRAHKIVLSACSSVLKDIIDSNPAGAHLVYHTGIERPELESMLHSMYVGEGKFSEESRGEFVKVENDFGVTSVAEHFEGNEEKTQKNAGQNSQCPECGAAFKRIHKMLEHYKSKHEGVRYQCSLCDYQATQQHHLKRHVVNKHETMKYSCNECNFQSRRIELLRRHKRVKRDR